MRLTDAFGRFHKKIALTALSEERVNRAWGRLHDHLTVAYGLPDTHVFIQGSYANDTAVRPASSGGEYDLDLVCLSSASGADAEETIEVLTEVLRRDADLAGRIEPNESGRPCVRLRYADDPQGFGFHVDIVPARGTDPTGVLEVPMRGLEDWRASAPYRYTAWCLEQPEAFRRVVRFLKRWRDVHGDGSIASITLQVLAAETLAATAGSDAEALLGTLRGMRERLAASPDSAPMISNPVLPTEDLGDRWKDEDYGRFRVELEEAVEIAAAAITAAESERSHELWRELLGEDFPATSDDPGGGEGGPPAMPPPPNNPDRRQLAPEDERYG
jgi:hypothetical protein